MRKAGAQLHQNDIFLTLEAASESVFLSRENKEQPHSIKLHLACTETYENNHPFLFNLCHRLKGGDQFFIGE